MYALPIALSALAATYASANPLSLSEGPRTTSTFGLRASTIHSKDLVGWPILNAHIDAGTNVLAVQRPSAFQPDKAFLNGTLGQVQHGRERLSFGNLAPSIPAPFEARLPDPFLGHIGQITVKAGEGSHVFAIVAPETKFEGPLLVHGSQEGFWVCPTRVGAETVFTLFWGEHVESENLPDKTCQEVLVEAFIQS